MDSYDILVITLSVLLAIFLMLSISIAVVTLLIFLKIKKGVEKAQHAAESINQFASEIKSMGKVAGIATLFKRAYDTHAKKDKKNHTSNKKSAS